MFKKFFNWISTYFTNIANQYPDCAESKKIQKDIKSMNIEYGKLQWTKNGLRNSIKNLGADLGKLAISFVKYMITLIPIVAIIAGVVFVVVKVIF